MKLLDAVNLIMPKLGERPVTSLEVKHPTLAILLPIIEQRQKETLIRGWWFNEFDYTAQPALNGEITLGIDTLAFVPKCSNAALRGLRLFNPETMSFVFTAPVEGRITQNVAFDELPESAANFVFYTSLNDAYATDLGVTQELQVWASLAGSAWDSLLAEHLRNKKHSTRKSRHWRKLISAMQG